MNRLYADKYYEFHTKMMTHQGRVNDKVALGYAKELGMDDAKIKAESEKKEVDAILTSNRELGAKLRIQGTPTMIIGDEVVPHGMDFEELERRLKAADTVKE